MSEASDIAAKIDAMTLDELVAASTSDLPTDGGDYDTRRGWARRLEMDIKAKKFVLMWKMLEDAGLLTMRRGHVCRGDHMYRTTLYHCPTLARKLAERAAD